MLKLYKLIINLKSKQMNMLNLFEEEINKLQTIELNEKDLIGGGVNAKVYRYNLKNTVVAVKCFQEKEIAI